MIRVSISQINTARELLDMLYKPSELAKELGMAKETIYAWAKVGMPFQKDVSGRTWIPGNRAAEWILSNGLKQSRKQRRAKNRRANTAYCLKCRDFREFTDAIYETISGGRIRLIAKCAKCGKTIYQFQKVKNDKPH